MHSASEGWVFYLGLLLDVWMVPFIDINVLKEISSKLLITLCFFQSWGTNMCSLWCIPLPTTFHSVRVVLLLSAVDRSANRAVHFNLTTNAFTWASTDSKSEGKTYELKWENLTTDIRIWERYLSNERLTLLPCVTELLITSIWFIYIS